MKKLLPSLILFLSVFLGIMFFNTPQTLATGASPGTTATTVSDDKLPAGTWRQDSEVTFIGKSAARARTMLDWTIQNYNWICVERIVGTSQCNDTDNPLQSFWLRIVTYIVVPLLFVAVLISAAVIIITRGRSVTIMRLLPRFLGVVILIFFTYSLLQFFYQFSDLIQGFFLRHPTETAQDGTTSCPPSCIGTKDLLYVGWDYDTFLGLRLASPDANNSNAESAFMSLLLTKMTAMTYYVMVGILILRKIILWFFIVVSPVFPLLLLFYPIRNTAKIWIGEFFRWLLYAPLFAIFLQGLVFMWSNPVGIPLDFKSTKIGVEQGRIGSPAKDENTLFPTTVNILLGGPQEVVTISNSINLTETFAKYVVALLMLWGVIILPWILLQIFLDYSSNFSVGDTAVMRTLLNVKNKPPAPTGTPPSTGPPFSLPFAKKFDLRPPQTPPSAPTGVAKELPISTGRMMQSHNMPSAQIKAQTLSLSNVTLPTIRDIAKYDTAITSRDTTKQQDIIRMRDTLTKIGNPASSSSDSQRYTEVRSKLTKESQDGNQLAASILSAANIATNKSAQNQNRQIKNVLNQIANPTTAPAVTKKFDTQKVAQLHDSLAKASKQGNALATSILSVDEKTSEKEIEALKEKIAQAKKRSDKLAAEVLDVTDKEVEAGLPAVNRVQTVSQQDYQAVKDMWRENYKNLEVPQGMAGTRSDWIKEDVEKINNIVNMLSSTSPDDMKKGMDEVSDILPFLLVGGFSQTEIISYLKAKKEAGQEVNSQLATEEDDKVEVSTQKAETKREMAATLEEEDATKGQEASQPSSVSVPDEPKVDDEKAVKPADENKKQ